MRGMENLSHILHEMLKVLGQQPGWLSTTLSTIMGMIVGLFGGLIKDLFLSEFVGRRNMRKALYCDIAQMFSAVDLIMSIDESRIGPGHPDKLLWRQEQFQLFPFLSEQYYSGNPAIYIQLRERFAAQTIYRDLRYVLELPPNSLPITSRNLTNKIAFYVDEGVLKRKYFKKYLRPKEKSQALLSSRS